MDTSFFKIFAGIALLYLGASWLVKSATTLALRAGVSPFLIGLTIVGYGTSLPELITTVQAAAKGYPDIAAGNIFGSNILNTSLILGLGIMIRPTFCKKKVRFFDAPFMLVSSILLFFTPYLPGFHRIWGFFLLLLLAFFTLAAYLCRNLDLDDSEFSSNQSLPLAACLLPIGIILLLYGAHIFLTGSTLLAEKFHLSETFIGLTITALGTSLPELATTIVAAWRKQPMLLVGGIIGSSIYNTLGILGAVSALYSISLEGISPFDSLFMIFLSLWVCLLLWIRSYLGRFFGALLCISYFLYLYILVFAS
ncbi:MAG: calcium/sodium antiporter [Chlamydiota bacterium]